MTNGYPTYRFNSQDPAIGIVVQLMKISNQTKSAISKSSGVARNTLIAWQKKRTRRAYFATLAAVAGALHHEFRPVRKR